MARFSDRLREGQWLVVSWFGMGLFGLLYSLSSSVWIAIALISVSGLLNAPSFVAGRLINQRHTPREMRGRVFSTSGLISTVLFLVGMGLAGLADAIDVRLLFVAGSFVVIGAGLITAVLPGLGQPAAEWRRAISLLRGAGAAPGMGYGRPASIADLDTLLGYVPSLAGLPPRDREALVTSARVRDATAGAAIMRAGDASDSAYFLLSGRAVAGLAREGEPQRTLSAMETGDIFGEIAALTGSQRTADVVAEEQSSLLEIPAATLRRLMEVPDFRELVQGKMTERLARTASLADLPRFGGFDQTALRQARSEIAADAGGSQPAAGAEPAA